MTRLAHYRDVLNFDATKHIPFTRQYSIRCSSCAAVVINNVPCHERRCPNAVHECAGCNEMIPMSRRWCDDCV